MHFNLPYRISDQSCISFLKIFDLLQIANQDFMEVCATFPVSRGIMASPVVGFVIRFALWKNVIQSMDVN